MAQWVKNPITGDTEDAVSIYESGRSPGGGNGNPFQYSCLGNPMTENPGRLQYIGFQRVGHSRAAELVLLVASKGKYKTLYNHTRLELIFESLAFFLK